MDYQTLAAQLDHALEALEIADADEARQTAVDRFTAMQRDLEAEAHHFRVVSELMAAKQKELAGAANLVGQLGNHAADAIRSRDTLSASWVPTADTIRRTFRNVTGLFEETTPPND